MPKSINKLIKEKECYPVSTAYSKSGSYTSWPLISKTNSLNISSEMGALALSALNKDYKVEKIITQIETDEVNVSPLVLKILVDHSARTHIPIEYKIINKKKKVLFKTKDSALLLPFYKQAEINIDKFKSQKTKPNFVKEKFKNPEQLKKYAIQGIERNFPYYNGSSSYGTAVATKDRIYFGGLYSSLDKTCTLHSEMTTTLSALMNGEKEITHIGVVSSKFPDSPCNMCGICRQFLSDICAKLNISPTLYCFAKDSKEYREYKIEEYLPSAWKI